MAIVKILNRKRIQHEFDMEGAFLFKIKGFKEKFKKYNDEYAPCSDCLCFDGDYFMILQDLKTRNGIKSVTDIGCAFGYQSEHFISNGYKYIGIDVGNLRGDSKEFRKIYKNLSDEGYDYDEIRKKLKKDNIKEYTYIPYFNGDNIECKYFTGHFPEDLHEGAITDCFLTNMSVGYEHPDIVNIDEIKKGYAKFDRGYFRGPNEIEVALDTIFKYKDIIYEGNMNNLNYYYNN
ncbi:MAG: hypothetical protein K0R54_560 [Clostridiaceae bacterium]|jgi:hypothetical protein|nr:hypothetical protein [Clostridiaceae bacterium]